MEPILTLPYSEWLVAEHIMKQLPTRDGYSVYAPLSRQEKGIDLIVTRRAHKQTLTASIQVKYSRVWENKPSSQERFTSRYNVFDVPNQADFIILVALYPRTDGRGDGKRSSWWSPLFLLFDQVEMRTFMAGVRKKRDGRLDIMFYFAFSPPHRGIFRGVFQSRGNEPGSKPDFTNHAFPGSLQRIAAHLGATSAHSDRVLGLGPSRPYKKRRRA